MGRSIGILDEFGQLRIGWIAVLEHAECRFDDGVLKLRCVGAAQWESVAIGDQ